MRHWVRSYRLLLIWALLRTRNELPVYAVVQAMLSIGVVLGFGFVIPHMTASTALYLCTGSMTLSVITIGMLLAPQAISYQKQSGFLDFQRSLPVPRTTLMAADTTLWAAITLPGVVLAFIVSTFRFDLTYQAHSSSPQPFWSWSAQSRSDTPSPTSSAPSWSFSPPTQS